MPLHFSPIQARRRAIAAALVAAPALWFGARAQAPIARRATPGQGEGPFYPVELPKDSDFDLLRNGSLAYGQGQPAWVEGTLTDLAGKPVVGAQIDIWQCDHAGRYHHPGDGNRADTAFQGFGRVFVDAAGAWRFRTIRPVAYSSRTPHIHVKIRLGSRTLLTSQLYVQDDPGNARDFVWRNLRDDADRAAVTAPYTAGADGQRASYAIVVAA